MFLPDTIYEQLRLEMPGEISRRTISCPGLPVPDIFAYGASIGDRLELFSSQPRCMDYARRLISEHEQSGRSFPSGSTFIARKLSDARGRFARSWYAPEGGLWLSLVIVNTLLPQFSRFYPLAAGLSCVEAVNSFGVDARVKWVNDIHKDKKKLAGILIESKRGDSGEEYLLLGIGINANNTVFPPELDGLAVSMKEILGKAVALEQLAARLILKLRWNFGLLNHTESQVLAEEGDSGEPPAENPVLDAWLKQSDTLGRRVMFGFDIQQNPQYQAVVEGVDRSGGLLLRLSEDNSLVTEYAGEISYLD